MFLAKVIINECSSLVSKHTEHLTCWGFEGLRAVSGSSSSKGAAQAGSDSKELVPEPAGGPVTFGHPKWGDSEQASPGPVTGDESVDAPSEAGVSLWDPGPCCMEGGTSEYRQYVVVIVINQTCMLSFIITSQDCPIPRDAKVDYRSMRPWADSQGFSVPSLPTEIISLILIVIHKGVGEFAFCFLCRHQVCSPYFMYREMRQVPYPCVKEHYVREPAWVQQDRGEWNM